MFASSRRMHVHRTLGRALALPLAATLVSSCGGPPVPVHAFEASAEPLREDAPYELDANDTCRWLDDGRLLVEAVSERVGNYASVTRIWIRFEPPDRPRVEVSDWNESFPGGSKSARNLLEGRSWVSSDGVELGEAGAPDLTIDMEYTYLDSGSPTLRGRRLVLHADALRRDED